MAGRMESLGTLVSGVAERRRRMRAAARRGVRRASRRVTVPLRRRYTGLFTALAVFGPGLIAANAGNDAGGIATYASAGATFGYSLLWVMFLITISLAVIQEMCARMGAVTGKGMSDLMRENFGIRWTALATLGLFIANAGVALSEFLGIAAVGDLFGIPRWIIVPVSAAALWALVVYGSYRTVERVFLALTIGFFAYPLAAFLARPHLSDVAHGVLVPTIRRDPAFIQMMVALIGTTITPYMQLFVQSSTAEKGGGMKEYHRADTFAGAVFGVLVASFLIIATAATLHVQGITVETADDAARALEPFAGRLAKELFGVGLFGACMLAGAVLPLTTAYSLSEAFGFEKGISRGFREAPVFMGVFTGLIVAGTLLALVPGLPVITILLGIQVLNGMLSPIVLIAALRLSNDPDIMGEYRNGPVFNVIATITVIAIVLLTITLLVMTFVQLLT